MKKTFRFVLSCAVVFLAVAVVRAQAAVATVEAQLVDGTSGALISQGGPWTWGPGASGTMAGIPAGNGRTLLVQCRDSAGDLVATGQLAGITILPADPFTGLGFLVVQPDGDGIAVLVGMMPGLWPVDLVPVGDDPPAELPVLVDIKPGSAANPVNVRSKGVLPVAILGSADLDVTAIDTETLALAGVAPLRAGIEDIDAADGYADLVLKFRTADIVAALGTVVDREELELILTGALIDGTAITGSDIITVRAKAKQHGPKK